MLSRTKKQLSLAWWWNQELWHEIYEGVGDNEGECGGRKGVGDFLRRLELHSCAAALPPVGKHWSQAKPNRKMSFPSESGPKIQYPRQYIFISQGVIWRKKNRDKKALRKTKEKRQRERDWAHTLNIDNVWFFYSTFASESGTSSTRLFLNCPSSTGTSCSHIFHRQWLGFSITLHLTAEEKKTQKERGTESEKGMVSWRGREKCAAARWEVKSRDQEPSAEYERCWTLYRLDGRMDGEEVVRGDGRGPGQVWPEVSVFLEVVSQILLTGAVSSVTGRRGDSEIKGALDALTAQSGWRASRNSFPSPYSPFQSHSLWTIYFSKLREKKKKKNCSVPLHIDRLFSLPLFCSFSFSRSLAG